MHKSRHFKAIPYKRTSLHRSKMSLLTPALQTYSILAASLAAGANLTTSIITFPALLHATGQTLTKQWLILYEAGIVPVTGCALTSSLGFATLAYRASFSPTLTTTGVSHAKGHLYVAAAVGLFGLAPYTRLLMWSTITEISNRARSGKEASEKADTRELVERWGTMNFWRGVMLLGSAGAGVWASLL
ncbi:hypothetical protein BU23DRAFT_602467 [Bimuria novae-zelandiae CBS 107.79]|uniref:DUF1772-domain-containing protein n=1 Tax=Bimuria novae-zelandiae CBS 107.79 TaxID=1447943 RepID=A0A6A5UTH5_9PLEO|nr:hypothetical protein BU23DRAFT_602467 [Bimuria novae-zelandiae CBS 107.79]